MKITLKDLLTGRGAVTTDFPEMHEMSVFAWTESNWSCDCNRAYYFGNTVDEEDDEENGVGFCDGKKRYIVTKVEPMPEGYTLADFNEGYPCPTT